VYVATDDPDDPDDVDDADDPEPSPRTDGRRVRKTPVA
jgi:hypothetical protein